MNKAYVIAPLILLLAFMGVYWKSTSAIKQHAIDAAARVEQARLDKLAAEAEAKKKAVEKALADQEQRKKEREEREAQKRAENDARLSAKEALNKARLDQDSLQKKRDSLKRDIATQQDEIKKIEENRKTLLAEKEFLKDYVVRARANAKSLEAVLTRIAEADKAAEDAAKAAAAAAKAKK